MAILNTTHPNEGIHLTCTPLALQHITNHIKQQKTTIMLRIRLKKAGCSGWLYQFDYTNQPQADEVTYTINSEVKLLLPKPYLKWFDAVIIDYIKSAFGGSLTCINPNEGMRCGCGESFTMNI